MKSKKKIEFKAYIGLKHIEPFIEDAVEKMHEDGIEEAVSIVLAPHFSTFSVKSYNGRAQEKAARDWWTSDYICWRAGIKSQSSSTTGLIK